MNARRIASLVIVAAMSLVLHTNHSDGAQNTVTGEVVETYCWAKLKVGGPAHASCGIECAKRGIPVAIVDKASHKVFVLLPGRSKMSVPPELVAMMGREVTIAGEVAARGGSNFLMVDSWKLARPMD
jgi:uncharacterized Zn-binding protein involved in type VI secretion